MRAQPLRAIMISVLRAFGLILDRHGNCCLRRGCTHLSARCGDHLIDFRLQLGIKR
jgi:hypothetical protein